MEPALNRKLDDLKHFIADVGKDGVVIAFSGGVDSTTLAAITYHMLGSKAVAVVAQSPTYSDQELREAKQLAREIGIQLYVIVTEELINEDFAKNPENRCYYCKKELLKKLKAFGRQHHLAVVFEGTNFSDLGDHRPGFKAVQEVEGAYSPWVANKFSKEEIRQIAKNLALSVYDKPSLACLASRIPFGDRITAQRLQRIEKAETAIKEITNVKQVRVRDHHDLARVEVGVDERGLFCNVDVLDMVAVALKKLGFKYVTLDLEGYHSGSMLKALVGA